MVFFVFFFLLHINSLTFFYRELTKGQKEYKELMRQALEETNSKSIDEAVIGKIGLKIKSSFSKKHMMRKF